MVERMAERRSYGQHCAIAWALDLVGERWTLLIVRELLLGPLRYTDLLEGLPGIGTNLLARRLQDLEQAGVLERRILPRPASSTVYALTSRGHSLEPAIVALGRFGGRLLPEHPDGEVFRPRWAVTGLKHTFRPDRAPRDSRRYQLDLDGESFHLKVADRELVAAQGPDTHPDVTLRSSARELLDVLGGHISVRQARGSAVEVLLAPHRQDVADPGGAQTAALREFVTTFGWGSGRHRTTPEEC